MGPIGPLGPLAAGRAAHVAACGAGAHVGAAVAMGGRAAQQCTLIILLNRVLYN